MFSFLSRLQERTESIMVNSKKHRLALLWTEEAHYTAMLRQIIAKNRGRSRMHVHIINKDRRQKGMFTLLMPQLEADPSKFMEYFRIDLETFDMIHEAIHDDIVVDASRRPDFIETRQRLAICLRYCVHRYERNTQIYWYQ